MGHGEGGGSIELDKRTRTGKRTEGSEWSGNLISNQAKWTSSLLILMFWTELYFMAKLIISRMLLLLSKHQLTH